jgi:DNA-binding MarR family transcriptional regulator
MSHPAIELDDVIHQRVRLGILAILFETPRVEFKYLKETLGQTDGNISRHLSVLEQAGFVKTTKGFEGKRPRTWAAATKLGRDAFRAEIRSLKRIVGSINEGAASAGDPIH